MINKLIQWLRGPRWICTPYDWIDERGSRVIVRAWTSQGARMKARDYLQAENIVVRPYEK